MNKADEIAIKNFTERKQNEFGKKLYHYTSVSAFLSMVDSREIWLSNTGTMNDLKECLYFIERLEEQLADYNRSDFFKKVYAQVPKNYQYAMSLSTEKDDAAQWERYADSAQGVCIVFDVANLIKMIYGQKEIMFNSVFYGTDVKNHDFYKLIKKYFETGVIDIYASEEELISFLLYVANYQKHPAFKHECEVRISVKDSVKNDGFNEDIKIVDSLVKKVIVLKPDEIGRMLNINFEQIIDSVIIGPKSKQNIEVLREYLRSKNMNQLAERVYRSECPLR